MPTDELRGSVNSVFLDFTYGSESEHEFKIDKLKRPLYKNTSTAGKRNLGGDDKSSRSIQICKRKAKGYSDYHKVNTNVNHVHLQLNTIPKDVNQDFIFCKNDVKETPITTRATQTLYRESSAQTLPYLPEIKNKPEELQYSELFKVSEILPGEGPPGVYEVEILERARRRWAFADAVRHHLRNDIDDIRKRLCQGKYKKILENFAFEQWIEREEYIMECQMMRFEIVVRMFNQRERQLHEQSKKALEQEHLKILAKRDAALRKNDIEFRRDMRRLDRKHNKQLNSWRDWRKERMSRQLGDPASLYNAPQIRMGVNPNRRHYKPPQGNVFNWNIPLDPNDVDMNKLECPFNKLAKWSEPKKRTQEIETNFLSDENLQKLYETLKSLRLQLVKHKVEPKCLKKREAAVKYDMTIDWDSIVEEEEQRQTSVAFDIVHSARGEIRFKSVTSKGSGSTSRRFTQKFAGFAALMRQEKQIKRLNFIDRRREEIECLLAAYEGKNIGWIMRLLGEELQRLQELRKLHAITILAQRERWRREAAEAGMRQKENEMRQLFEELFRSANNAESEVCQQYCQDIFKTDIQVYANQEAEDQVTLLAKQIDDDLERWMGGILCVQQPSSYDFLRYLLKELAFPNFEKIVYKTETKKIVNDIINDVLLPKVYMELDPYDISFAISNELVDRLTYNDLYYFTSEECLNDETCEKTCEDPENVRESRSIIRKLIRQAVPGRRWKTSTERIAYENFMDIVDEAFDAIDPGSSSTDTSYSCYGDLKIEPSIYNLSHHFIYSPQSGTSVHFSERPSRSLVYNAMSQTGDLCTIDSSHDLHQYFPHKFRVSLSTTFTSSEVFCDSWNQILESHVLVNKILYDLISEIIIEEEPSDSTYFAEENVIDNEKSESVLLDTNSIIDFVSMNALKDKETLEEEECIPQDTGVVEIAESELIRLTDDKCKCEEDKQKLRDLLHLIAIGKVLIIRKTESELEVMSSGSKNITKIQDRKFLEEKEQELTLEQESNSDVYDYEDVEMESYAMAGSSAKSVEDVIKRIDNLESDALARSTVTSKNVLVEPDVTGSKIQQNDMVLEDNEDENKKIDNLRMESDALARSTITSKNVLVQPDVTGSKIKIQQNDMVLEDNEEENKKIYNLEIESNSLVRSTVTSEDVLVGPDVSGSETTEQIQPNDMVLNDDKESENKSIEQKSSLSKVPNEMELNVIEADESRRMTIKSSTSRGSRSKRRTSEYKDKNELEEIKSPSLILAVIADGEATMLDGVEQEKLKSESSEDN